MISALSRYGAMATKARAMYGNRFRASQYRHIASLSSLTDVMEYLCAQPGWTLLAQQLEGIHVDRSTLEDVLHNHLCQEYVSLSAFIPRGDNRLVSFPVYQAELRAIMSQFNHLRPVHTKPAPLPLPPRFLKGSKLDFQGLANATTYDGILAACQHTIFHPPLLRLYPEPGSPLPNYPATEALLHSAYFSHMYRLIGRGYTGTTEKLLRRSLGEQVDLLNITHVLRLKKYFPQETDFYRYLFPFHHRLRPDILQALCGAPSLEAAFSILAQTPYAANFEAMEAGEVEAHFQRIFYQFNRRQLMMGTPSIYTAMAYLNLRDLEMKALVNTIESVKYAYGYDEDFVRLIGE